MGPATTLPPGVECHRGGIGIPLWADVNQDQTFQSGELLRVLAACRLRAPSEATCAPGLLPIAEGLDLNLNRLLDAAEVQTTCNTGVVSASAGAEFTCAVVSNGTVRCWGANWSGQLGDGTTAARAIAADVSGIGNAVAVGAGTAHACAVLADSTVKCWGYGAHGQIGDGTSTPSVLTPVSVSSLSGVAAVSAGYLHTCALLTDGRVFCWGYGANGELGTGDYASSLVPVEVTGLTGVAGLDLGQHHACAALTDGEGRCWGRNNFGQLTSAASNAPSPIAVAGLSGGVSAFTLGYYHTCALLADSTVQCWGYGYNGELGNGMFTQSAIPVNVVGLLGATTISAGNNHSCASLIGGAVACWGFNGGGALGNGDESTAATPVNVIWPSNDAASVVVGGGHSCLVDAGATMAGWGDDWSGQTGDGSPGAHRNVPGPVIGVP